MKANKMRKGSVGIIKQIQLPKKDKKRLFFMGFCEGCELQYLKRAPMQDPLLFFIKGNQVILREAIAACIEVEVIRK